MYVVNEIFRAMKIKPLSYLEELTDEQGIDLIKLKEKNSLQAYCLSLIYYPKTIIYRKDIEYVESIFKLCGDNILDAYINLIRYYSGYMKRSDDSDFSYNVSISLDMYSKSEDIVAIVSAERNTTLVLRTIKFPLSTLGDKTLLKYSLNPQELLDDIVNKSRVYLTQQEDKKIILSSDRKIKTYVIDINDIIDPYMFLKGFVIGQTLITDDLALFKIQDNIDLVYIKDDVLYSNRLKVQNILDPYSMDTDFIYMLYSIIRNNVPYITLSEFIEGLRGYIKRFKNRDIYKDIVNITKFNEETHRFEEQLTKDGHTISAEKIEALINV